MPGALKFGGVLPRLLAYWLDSILITIVMGVLGAVLGVITGNSVDTVVISTVLSVGISALYFVGFWTADSRATLGMRLFHLQIGQAADGRTLGLGQAVTRWAALGYPFALLSVIPALAIPVSGLLVIWEVVLLVTTAMSPTRQGLSFSLVLRINGVNLCFSTLIILLLYLILCSLSSTIFLIANCPE